MKDVMNVNAAGQLPEGVNLSKMYNSRQHPKGIQMTIFGVTDCLRNLGKDWDSELKPLLNPKKIGVFSGPNQASSRSMMARLIPRGRENEFFGFYAFTGKATAFIGPMLLGILTEIFKSQRYGVSVVMLMFCIGAIILNFVDEKEGIKYASKSVE